MIRLVTGFSGNGLRKIDNCFAKSGRSSFQIINVVLALVQFAVQVLNAVIPKRIVGGESRASDFVIPSSLVIRASSFALGGAVQFRVQPHLGKFPVTPHRYP